MAGLATDAAVAMAVDRPMGGAAGMTGASAGSDAAGTSAAVMVTAAVGADGAGAAVDGGDTIEPLTVGRAAHTVAGSTRCPRISQCWWPSRAGFDPQKTFDTPGTAVIGPEVARTATLLRAARLAGESPA